MSPFDDGVIDGLRIVGARFGKLLPGLVIVGVALYCMLLTVKAGGNRATAFTLLPLALGLFLLVGVELFYLADVFGNRMNTVFKIYYQAWVLLAIVSAYGLYYCSRTPLFLVGSGQRLRTVVRLPLRLLGRTLSYGWVVVVVILFLGSIYYPVAAALDRTKGTSSDTLDGLTFLLERGDSAEYEAILWLRDEAPRGRIVEAVGNDWDWGYDYGRISSSSGLPTILGWRGHEHQWRGTTEPFHGRADDVAQIYSSDDPERVRLLLDTYDVRYVYVGPRERADYGDSHFDKFLFLRPVCRLKGVVIYERLKDGGPGIVERCNGGAG